MSTNSSDFNHANAESLFIYFNGTNVDLTKRFNQHGKKINADIHLYINGVGTSSSPFKKDEKGDAILKGGKYNYPSETPYGDAKAVSILNGDNKGKLYAYKRNGKAYFSASFGRGTQALKTDEEIGRITAGNKNGKIAVSNIKGKTFSIAALPTLKKECHFAYGRNWGNLLFFVFRIPLNSTTAIVFSFGIVVWYRICRSNWWSGYARSYFLTEFLYRAFCCRCWFDL